MKRASSRKPDRLVALSSAQRRWRALLAGGCGSLAAALAFLNPESIPSFSCGFHEVTGYSCFTCGLTRSLLAIAHGHFVSSLGYHLMGPAVFLGLLMAIVSLGTEALFGRGWDPKATSAFWRGALVFVILVWITYGGIRLALELAG